ncbi:hypothetical protein C8F01DRAFT_1237175 [Mycena amicta]|nr:hypothetical protein C8F01DRAFT_1237175 [Mycena amicta]
MLRSPLLLVAVLDLSPNGPPHRRDPLDAFHGPNCMPTDSQHPTWLSRRARPILAGPKPQNGARSSKTFLRMEDGLLIARVALSRSSLPLLRRRKMRRQFASVMAWRLPQRIHLVDLWSGLGAMSRYTRTMDRSQRWTDSRESPIDTQSDPPYTSNPDSTLPIDLAAPFYLPLPLLEEPPYTSSRPWRIQGKHTTSFPIILDHALRFSPRMAILGNETFSLVSRDGGCCPERGNTTGARWYSSSDGSYKASSYALTQFQSQIHSSVVVAAPPYHPLSSYLDYLSASIGSFTIRSFPFTSDPFPTVVHSFAPVPRCRSLAADDQWLLSKPGRTRRTLPRGSEWWTFPSSSALVVLVSESSLRIMGPGPYLLQRQSPTVFAIAIGSDILPYRRHRQSFGFGIARKAFSLLRIDGTTALVFPSIARIGLGWTLKTKAIWVKAKAKRDREVGTKAVEGDVGGHNDEFLDDCLLTKEMGERADYDYIFYVSFIPGRCIENKGGSSMASNE